MVMEYKFILSEKKVREFLDIAGWVLIEPGCTTLHKDGTTTYEPPQYCCRKEDDKIKRKVDEVIQEVTEFALSVLYSI